MTKTMNERFEEINKIISSHVDNNITRANVSCVANIKDGGRQLNQFIVVNKIINILEQEISLAKEEERKRIVEIIEESKQSIIKGNNITYWKESAEKFIEKIITLITNNK